MRSSSFIPLLVAATVSGQCSFSGSGLFYWTDCSDPGFILAEFVGGTPPYHIQTTSGINPSLDLQGHMSSTYQLDLDWSGYSPAGSLSFWSVTDAMGCTTEFAVHMQNALPGLVNLVRTVDCTTGTTNNELQFFASACPASTYTWSIVGQGGPVSSGQVGSLPLTGPNTYRLPNLPDGDYTLQLSEGFGQCGQFDLHDCWQPIPFTHVNISAGDCGVNFRLNGVLLGVAFSGGLMQDGLRSQGLIPPSQPYTGLGYNFIGSTTNVSVSPALLAASGSNAIVDWVVVELRNSPANVVYSKPALLQRDGDVVDADGSGYLNFPVPAGMYYVALRHRNHLGVRTSFTWNLGADPAATYINLRIQSNVYGINALGFNGALYGLWAGDATGNGQLRYTGTGNDRDPILTAVGGSTPNNTVPNVYDRRDTNLDGVIKYTGSANDRDVILTNVGSTTPNNTRTQQLP